MQDYIGKTSAASCARCSPKLGPEDLGRVRQPTDRLTDPPLPVSRLHCSEGVFTAGSLLVEGLPLLIV
jgi:hypothetical protein